MNIPAAPKMLLDPRIHPDGCRPRIESTGDRNLNEVPSNYIQETLSIYRDEFIALENAFWDGAKIEGQFVTRPYPFTKPGHVDYVTAAMATLYLSQLSYIAARLLIENGALRKHPNLDTAHFMKVRDKGDLVITGLKFRFRRKLPTGKAPITVALRLKRIASTKSSAFGEFDFSFEESAASGSLVVAMPLPD